MTSITDIWFRSERELLEVVNALGLPAIVQDVDGAIRCGQWIHRAGSDFDRVVVEERG